MIWLLTDEKDSHTFPDNPLLPLNKNWKFDFKRYTQRPDSGQRLKKSIWSAWYDPNNSRAITIHLLLEFVPKTNQYFARGTCTDYQRISRSELATNSYTAHVTVKGKYQNIWKEHNYLLLRCLSDYAQSNLVYRHACCLFPVKFPIVTRRAVFWQRATFFYFRFWI